LGGLIRELLGVPALAGEGQDWQANGQGGGAPDRLKPGLRARSSRMRPSLIPGLQPGGRGESRPQNCFNTEARRRLRIKLLVPEVLVEEIMGFASPPCAPGKRTTTDYAFIGLLPALASANPSLMPPRAIAHA